MSNNEEAMGILFRLIERITLTLHEVEANVGYYSPNIRELNDELENARVKLVDLYEKK